MKYFTFRVSVRLKSGETLNTLLPGRGKTLDAAREEALHFVKNLYEAIGLSKEIVLYSVTSYSHRLEGEWLSIWD